jgi:arylsulfatase A-like enzyme
MKKRQSTVLFFLLGITAGFLCGLIPAACSIVSNRYWEAGMYVLIAEQVVRHVLTWMSAGGFVFAVCGFVVAASTRKSAAVRTAGALGAVALLLTAAVLLGPRLQLVSAACVSGFLVLPCAVLFVPRVWQWLRGRRTAVVGSALACLLVLLAASGWLAIRGMNHRKEGPSFVLLVIDCLRSDHLGCYGYTRDTSPTLDAMARSGWQYERAYAPSPWTKPSVASLFSSLLPADHGLVHPDQSAPDQLLLLAEVLRNSGYKNFFINGGNVFLRKEFNLHQGFHSYDYLPHTTRSAPDLAQMLLNRVAGIGEGKFFAYLHFMDAHAPYTRNRHNTRYAKKSIEPYAPGNPETQLNDLREPGSVSPELQQYFRDLYDGQIRFVDESVRALLQGLKRLGRLDNTVFIITADHGEEFWEHGSAEHGHSLYNELLHVPLIIAGPPISARRISEPVSLIDVMPTMLDLAGIPHATSNPPAVSLLPGSGAPLPDRAIYASGMLYGPEAYCLILNNRKLIYRTSDQAGKWTLLGPQAPAGYQFFDLERDPTEHNNLAAAGKAPADLDRLLEDYIRTVPLAVPTQSVHVSGDAMRRQLESLGYVQ